MACGVFKDINRGTAIGKLLLDKAFNIMKNPKYDEYQSEVTSMIYKLFHQKIFDGINKKKIMSNKEVAEELDKAIMK